MDVTNEIVTLNYSAGILTYSVRYQKGITTNPNLALWTDGLNEKDYMFVHSTSWRFEKGLILTWLTKTQHDQEHIYAESPIVGSDSATSPGPVPVVSLQTIVAHGLRHLALLLTEDPVFRSAISSDFAAFLAPLVPATARQATPQMQ